jgi:hypothetical protein
MRSKLYPELEQLFSCYLHEDRAYFHPTVDAALEEGIAGLPPEALLAAGEEMDRLRNEARDTERGTKMVQRELGANYRWEVDGYTLDEWLAHVSEMLNKRRTELGLPSGIK